MNTTIKQADMLTELSLKYSELRYRRLFEAAQDGILILNAETGMIEDVNPYLMKMLGYSREEFVEKKLWEVGAFKDVEASRNAFEALQDNKYIRYEDLPLKAKNGKLIQVEFVSNVYLAGSEKVIQCNIRDITARKQTDDALQESEVRYRRLFETAQDGILILDAETGMIEDVNPYLIKMLGYSREEFVKKKLWEVGAFKDIEASQEAFEALQANEYIRYEDLPLKAKDGRLIQMEFVSNVYLVGDEKVIQCNIRDITVRRQAEKQIQTLLSDEKNQLTHRVEERTADLLHANMDLAYALRVKDEFLASMSHELRTPLTSILGFSEALQLKMYGELNAMQKKILNTIQESGSHLLDLINDVLDLAKIEAGKEDLQLSPCSIDDICQAGLQLTRGMAQQKNQVVHYSPPLKPVFVRADARRLKQILVNLLSNAIKFTPQMGELGLEIRPNESEKNIRLIIWDKGIGINPEDMRKLFLPFVQIDNGLARQYYGTGLGLSLVRRLAELHNGGIEMESKLGEGSRFTVILPWSPEDTVPSLLALPREAAIEADLISADHSMPPSILIADDNDMVLQMLSDFLESNHCHVIKAQTGFELLEQAEQFHPDLMLIDIQMPVMDGLETIRRIRSHADKLLAATPVIAITALVMPGDRERCMQAGANEYISKPLKLLELAAIIKLQLEKKLRA